MFDKKLYNKVDLSNQIRIIYNAKHRYAVHIKLGVKFLTFLTKLELGSIPVFAL